MKNLSALAAGLIFGLGLIGSQMISPTKVIGFLDVFGAWDPSLALVMGAAIPVALAGFWLAKRMKKPVFANEFGWPTSVHIDKKLLGGSALFGVGWGLAGFCPGPALVAASSLSTDALIFLACMLIGMAVFHLQTKQP